MNFWVPWKLGNTWSSWVAISMSKRLFYGVTVFRSEVSPQPSLSYGFYVYSRPFTKFIIIHHVPERLGMFPVPWSSRWNWSLHLFLGHPMFLCPFGLYCSACSGSLFVSILCTCRSHFYWYCFISFTMFCAPVFCLIHWFFSLSSFVIPSVSKISSVLLLNVVPLFFSTQASLPNFNATLAVMLWILNFVSLFICFPKCLHIALFILLYVCNLSSKSLPHSDMQYPKYLKSVICSIILSFITIFTLCMWFPHIAIDDVFVLDMVILYFLAIRFKWCAIVCNSSSDVAIKICNLSLLQYSCNSDTVR